MGYVSLHVSFYDHRVSEVCHVDVDSGVVGDDILSIFNGIFNGINIY